MSFPGVTEEQSFATLKSALEQVKEGEKLIINSVASGSSAPTPPAIPSPTRPPPPSVSPPRGSPAPSILTLQAEGHFAHIGLSECSAATLEPAAAIAPIATVEIEVSPVAWEEETRKVLATVARTGSVILAYSPIGRGLITAKTHEDLNPLVRRAFPRFSEENFAHNSQLATKIQALTAERHLTPTQVSIEWVKDIGQDYGGAAVVPIPGTTKVERRKENFGALDIRLSKEHRRAVTEMAEAAGIKGDRYPGKQAAWT